MPYSTPSHGPDRTSDTPVSYSPFPDSVTGILERVTYHNEENGYTVARLAIEGARDLLTLVGNFSNPIVGEQLICESCGTGFAVVDGTPQGSDDLQCKRPPLGGFFVTVPRGGFRPHR